MAINSPIISSNNAGLQPPPAPSSPATNTEIVKAIIYERDALNLYVQGALTDADLVAASVYKARLADVDRMSALARKGAITSKAI